MLLKHPESRILSSRPQNETVTKVAAWFTRKDTKKITERSDIFNRTFVLSDSIKQEPNFTLLTCGRFVEQNESRVADQSDGDRQLPLVPAAQVGGGLVLVLDQVQLLYRPLDDAPLVFSGYPPQSSKTPQFLPKQGRGVCGRWTRC